MSSWRHVWSSGRLLVLWNMALGKYTIAGKSKEEDVLEGVAQVLGGLLGGLEEV